MALESRRPAVTAGEVAAPAKGHVRAARDARAGLVRSPEGIAVLAGVVFALLAALGMLWPHHGQARPDGFWNLDETVNLLAASQVAETGGPGVPLPWEDPEDLLHMRYWYTDGDQALPAYPPFAYYIHAAGMKLGPLGDWFALLPVMAGVGALAAIGALTLRRKPWLGAMLPLAAFPLTYWLMRPWHSSGLSASMIVLAALFVVLWARSRRFRYFVVAAAFVAVAGAIRPDQLLYMFGATWLVALLVEREAWRRTTATLFVAGTCAVLVIVLLNWAVVGDPLQSGYQAFNDQPLPVVAGQSSARQSLPHPLQEAVYALAPWGFHFDLGFGGALLRYWVVLGPVVLLTGLGLAGLALIAKTTGGGRTSGALLLMLVALVMVFIASRYCPGCGGGKATYPSLEHTLLRYQAIAYLLVGVAALLLIERASATFIQRWASPFLAALVLFGGLWLGMTVQAQRINFASQTADLDVLKAELPDGSVVYSQYGGWGTALDPSFVAAQAPVAFKLQADAPAGTPAPVVPAAEYERWISSMLRAREHGHDVAIQSIKEENAAILDLMLRAKGLQLKPIAGLELAWTVEPVGEIGSTAMSVGGSDGASLPTVLREGCGC